MNQFICLFLPALLTFTKKDSSKTTINLLKKYASNTIIINIIVMLTVCVINSIKGNDFVEDFTIQFTLKYLVLACVIAKVLPSFRSFIRKNIKIEIHREDRQKNTKRH